MGQAAAAADANKPDLADEQTARAGKDLDEAQAKLAAARRKAEADLAHEQLARLEDSLKSLCDRQRHVNDETTRLEALRAGQGQFTRGQSQSLQDLSRSQQALAEDVAQAASKLAGVAAFQYVLESAVAEMQRIAEQLKNRETGRPVQRREQDVLTRIEQLTSALKEQSGGKPDKSSQAGDNQNDGQQGDNIRTMTEIRLVKLLQQELNRRTERLAESLIREPSPSAEQREEFKSLAQEQSRLAELLLGLTSGE